MEKKEYKKPSMKVRNIEVENDVLAASLTPGGDAGLEPGTGTPPPAADSKGNAFYGWEDDGGYPSTSVWDE